MFKHYFSLGCYCSVAATLERYGLRSFSGPFDWCMSEFKGVIQCIEDEFKGILKIDNLEAVESNPLYFRDRKYGFYFNHELRKGETLEDKYQEIQMKYLERGTRFLEKILEPTCFVRAIKNEDEIIYIRENEKKINLLLKKYNIENQIIYIVPERLANETDFLNAYRIDKYEFSSLKSLAAIFNKNNELKEYCIEKFDKNLHVENLLYQLNKWEKYSEIISCKHQILSQVLEYKNNNKPISEFFNGKKIIIYGLGELGKIFYDEIKENVPIVGAIDQKVFQDGFFDCPVLLPNSARLREIIENDPSVIIVVTPIWEFDEISHVLKSEFSEHQLRIVSLQDVLNILTGVVDDTNEELKWLEREERFRWI